jgi:hypothetical protein
MIKIGPGLGSIYFSAKKSGGPASLTITFGNGLVTSGTFFLTINGVQYSFSLGQFGFADVAIWFEEDGENIVLGGIDMPGQFGSYIRTAFSSSLTVLEYSNTLTLTTKATSGASLSAICSLPIFPNVPLT